MDKVDIAKKQIAQLLLMVLLGSSCVAIIASLLIQTFTNISTLLATVIVFVTIAVIDLALARMSSEAVVKPLRMLAQAILHVSPGQGTPQHQI